MIKVFNLDDIIINCDNDEDSQKLVEIGAEEIDISIFGEYAAYANNENTIFVDEWVFDTNMVIAQIDVQQNTPQALKLKGVDFNGTMCSATKEDMWGLSSVETWVRAGSSTSFKFDNGNTLLLTLTNIDAFQAVWVPFRAGFFS